ncbi:MAG TPA: flippase [Segeticoccus sp.]|uniref:flippase n=1 Tax=Segeticoccus sp. TaxID=2706531 RepID=UPI002D7FD738|nr:flippase [Segeticoccus sp.]HET8600728.1 flippase [Segeticoccus sp.]
MPSGPQTHGADEATVEGARPGRHGRAGGRTLATLARGGAFNLVGAVCNQVALFAIMAALARFLGSDDVGRYAECYALLSLVGLLSLAGFRAGLTRFVAVHLADQDPARLRGTVRLGLGITVAASAVLGLGMVVFAAPIAGLFDDPALTTGIRLTGLTLPAATFSDAALAATQGWRTQRPFTLIGRIYEPVARLGLTVAALLLGFGLTGAFWALLIGAWTASALAARAVFTRVRQAPPSGRAVYELRRIFSFSMVSWASALAATGLIWADTLLLGHLTDADEVGVYNVATRLVMLAVFVMAPINAAFAPHLAHLHHIGASRELATTYGAATSWIVRLSMPAFVALIVFPSDMLEFFGHDFRTGATVTAVLACGQLVSAVAGPCGTVLTMSGRVGLNMVDNVGVLVVNVGLNLWLIPHHGVMGAAVAWSFSLALANIAKFLQVRYVVQVVPASAGVVKSLLAGVPAAAAAVLIRGLLHTWLVELVVGGLVIVVIYVVTLLLLGLSPEDRLMLRTIMRRKPLATT